MQSAAHHQTSENNNTPGAQELLVEGRSYLDRGCTEVAVRLLVRVWETAQHGTPTVADAAAWELACLRLGAGEYREAAIWFERIHGQPPFEPESWARQRAALVRMCQSIAPQDSPGRVESMRTQGLPRLEVVNFGRFEIIRGGTTLRAGRSRKALTLFRYLLSRKHGTASKDEIIDLFWPHVDPAAGLHSLHVAVSSLRAVLDPAGGTYVLFNQGSYCINPEAIVAIDSQRFLDQAREGERLLRLGDISSASQALAEADRAYAGDYQIDADLLWEFAERERLATRYLEVLDYRSALHHSAGEHDTAIDCCQRLIERDEYREDIHARLMRSYLALGRRQDALRQYERCALLLANDLGLDPSPSLIALRDYALGRAPAPDPYIHYDRLSKALE